MAWMPKLLGQWKLVLGYIVGLAALFGVLWLRLNHLTPGYSPSEQATLQHSQSFMYIFHHPFNGPFTFAVRLLLLGGSKHGLLFTRLAATLFAAGTVVAFFLLIKYWHSTRTALFGAILFATSAWFLHTARLGTPDVLLFSSLVVLACGVWLKHTNSPIALLCCFVAACGLLYVPGMIWIIAAGALWQLPTIDRIFKKHLWIVSAGGLVFLAALLPLGLSIYHDPALAKVLAGLPANGWPAPMAALKHLADVPVQLFAHGPNMPEHWLGHLGVLDALTAAMAILGGYLYIRHVKLTRTWLLAVVLLVGGILVALGGSVTLTIIVPFMYMLAAAGIGFMLDRWETVFPRNVIARSLGVSLVALAIAGSAWYGTRQYFVAWPHSPATHAVFTVAVSDTINR